MGLVIAISVLLAAALASCMPTASWRPIYEGKELKVLVLRDC
jgi:hypothetical protein